MVPLAVAQAGDEVLLETLGLGCLYVCRIHGRTPSIADSSICVSFYNQTRSPGMHDVVRSGL